MHHSSSTNHNLGLLLDWLQIQLAVYVSVSIIDPLNPEFHHDTVLCASVLLCLAHRYFPHDLPDLIVRIDRQDENNTRVAQHLFLKHWNLSPSSNMLSFFSDLYVKATSINHDVTPTTPSPLQPTLCLLLEFVHAKLFRSSVLDTGWFEKLEQIMAHAASLLEKLPDNKDVLILHLKFKYLNGWLAQLRCWSQHGHDLYHSLRTSTPIQQASIDALHEQTPLFLSHPVYYQLSAQPLGAYHRHQFLQRRQKYDSHYKTIEAACLDECDRCTNELTPNTFRAAQRAHAILSGSASCTSFSSHDRSSSRYRALVSLYNNNQDTQRRRALEDEYRRSLDLFLTRSDELVSRGTLLKHALETCDLDDDFHQRLIAFEDDVHVLTERVARRITFPNHLDTTEAYYTISHHKATLWDLLTTLQNEYEVRKQKAWIAQQDEQKAHDVALAHLWMECREKAIKDASAGLDASGLGQSDLEKLMLEEEVHSSAIASFKLSTVQNLAGDQTVAEAYDSLIHIARDHKAAIQAYRSHLADETVYAEASRGLTTKIKAIWEVIMPLEEGHDLDTTLSFDDNNDGVIVVAAPRPAWLLRQERQYHELVDYGQRMVHYRKSVAALMKLAQEIEAEGAQCCRDFERALRTLRTTRPAPSSSESMAAFSQRMEKFRDAYSSLTKPVCSVEARSTRPEPCISSTDDADLLASHQTLSSVAQSVAQSYQNYTHALDLMHQADGCVVRAEECARAIRALSLSYPYDQQGQAAATDLLASAAEIGNDVRVLATKCTDVVHAQEAISSFEELDRLAAGLSRMIEQSTLDGQAAEAESAWEASYGMTRDAILERKDAAANANETRRLYRDMDRAFTIAGRDVAHLRARQMQLETDIVCLAEEQAKEARTKANHALLAHWSDQLDTCIAELSRHEQDVRRFIETRETSLVPDDEGLEALHQAGLLLPPTPGPDPGVFHKIPFGSVDKLFEKVLKIKDRRSTVLNALYAQAYAINNTCRQFQSTSAAIEASDGSASGLVAIESKIARFSGRSQQILKEKFALLEDRLKAKASEIAAEAKHVEYKTIVDQCALRVNMSLKSVDVDYTPLEITDVVNQALARLVDQRDVETVQALKTSALQALEHHKEVVRCEQRAQAQAKALSEMETLVDLLSNAWQDHETMEFVAETSCFAPMRALLRSHPDFPTLQDIYNDALQKHRRLIEDVREQVLISAQHRKQQVFEDAFAEYLAILEAARSEASNVRHSRKTDRAQLGALETQITDIITTCTSKYHEIRSLRTRDDEALENEMTRQFRATEDLLREALAYVNKMRGWANVREILDEATASIQTNTDTGPTRLLLCKALARMDDDDVDARMQYMELFSRVCAVESEQAALAAAKQEQEARKSRLSALQRTSDTILASLRTSCDNAVAAAATTSATADAIQEICLAGIAVLAEYRAQSSLVLRELNDHALQDALDEASAVYDMLEQVGEHAREAESILRSIEIQEASKSLSQEEGLGELASRIDRFKAMTISNKNVPPHLSMDNHTSVQRRVSLVESAWKSLLESMESLQAEAQRQKQLDQSNAKMDEMEEVLKHAAAQLSHIKWLLSDRDLETMPREPEALALKTRINTLLERTTTVLKDLRDSIENEPELIARQDQIDVFIKTLYKDIEDTQNRIDNALIVSEYLMLSDNIDLMLSIFKDHLCKAVPAKHDLIQNMLQTLEAQQKYYQEHIDEQLETASSLVVDSVRLHFEALCDRWASVQQQAQTRIVTLRQRLQRRGRLASFPTTLLTTTTATTTSSSSSPLMTPRPSRLLPPRPGRPANKIQQYQADPTNALDLQIGQIVNATQCGIKVEKVPGESGKYYFGLRHPRLVYCRILKSGMVMVRVGGGWCELSQFLRDHALLEDSITCIQDSRVSIQQGFFSTAQRPSLPPQLNRSNSTSTISSTNSTSSSATSVSAAGYLVDGNKYMAVDHLGNYHQVRMTKAADLPSISGGHRSVHMK
ncbi:hypothetical protein BX666DRAFT_2028847 [Dichotomocladium elegans]|nr:hypothetical protein BX666DRAFT_2028847 [Dichotomocladium elegans]